MKKFLILLTLIMLLFYLFACSNKISDIEELGFSKETERVLELYKELLQGERNISYNKHILDINQIISSEKDIDKDYDARYALFDTNGDGLPELHVKSQSHYFIVTYKDEDLIIWAELSPYHEQLNNRNFLYTRLGSAPPHISYNYIIMDFWGNNIFNLFFEKYDEDNNNIYDDNDFYLFNNVEVSKEQWEALTDEYLSIGSNQIQWFDIKDTNLLTNFN